MRAACLAALLALASASAQEAPSPKGGLPEPLQKKVDQAVVKGRAYLHDLLQSGTYDQPDYQADPLRETCVRLGGPGADALLGLALVQSGVPPTDPQLQRLWQTIRTRPARKVYTVAFELLFMEGMLHPPADAIPWPDADPRRRKERFPKDERDLEKVQAWMRKRAEWLASGQAGGAWGYFCPGVVPEYRVSEKKDRIETPEGLAPRLDLGEACLPPVTADPTAFGWHDYSNTQCAVLGLRAAGLCGVPLKDGAVLWRRAAQNLLLGQAYRGGGVALEGGILDPAQKGTRNDYTVGQSPAWSKTGEAFTLDARARGWGYRMPPFRMDPEVRKKAQAVEKRLGEVSGMPDAPDVRAARARLEEDLDRLTSALTLMPHAEGYVPGTSANMTAAGLTGLVLARAAVSDLEKKEVKALNAGIRDALAWYQKHWDWDAMIDRNRQRADGYALYGLERLGVLSNLRVLGKHAWYREGAEALVEIQAKDGSWSGEVISRYPPEVNTALCLLFLSCGTPAAYGR